MLWKFRPLCAGKAQRRAEASASARAGFSGKDLIPCEKNVFLAQLLLAIALTAAAVLGCGLLAVRAWMGEGGRSLVEGLRLVNTLFVGEYDETEVVDAALEGMVSGLGDRWSYYLTADELEAQNQRRTNQYVGVGITVNYTREEDSGLGVGPGPEAAGLEAGEVITAMDGVSLAGGHAMRARILSRGRRAPPSPWRCWGRTGRPAPWRWSGPS